MRAEPAEVTVKFDFDHRPLPDIPLPNDIATRPDASSSTGLRINASMIASTTLEQRTRRLIDGLDGWGVYQPISIPFTGPIDVNSVIARHREDNYDTSNDAIYLINIDRNSEEFGRIHHLDVGNGNYPVTLERLDNYGSNDPRGWTLSLPFEEADEDLDGDGELDPGEDVNRNGVLDPGEDRNGNGVLDPPEDTDADGILDKPNYLPNRTPARDDLIGRADALMSFYERETNTLLVAPMTPLREQTRYAVVVTRRIRDLKGKPVGSPFAYVNHTAQTDDLQPLMEVLPRGLDPEDIAFTFSYTTESITPDWIAVREGLYGYGVQAHLAEEFPAEVEKLWKVKATGPGEPFEGKNPYILNHEDWSTVLALAATQLLGNDPNDEQTKALLDSHRYVDFHAIGTYVSPQLFDRFDENLERLPLDEQVWPSDVHSTPVEARPEEIPWWLVVPRKEVSIRGEGKMAPLVLLGHGYTSNRVGELLGFGGYLSSFGIAVMSTDNVSHGLGISHEESDLLVQLVTSAGLEPALDGILFNRGGDVDGDGFHDQDLDRDGIVDSGADFWTAYLFHMRDMVRQSALDYMQLIRMVKSWDGKKTWPYDVNGDGIANDLAGDFDGDGVVDVGSESEIYVMGGSLGGIMSTVLGALEPHVDAIIPIAGGGRLTDVGNRSRQGGVPQAVLMRAMGPLWLVDVRQDGSTEVRAQVTELNRLPNIPILTPDGERNWPTAMVGDTVVVENLRNGEVRCGYVLPVDPHEPYSRCTSNPIVAGARVALPSDVGDEVRLSVYRGPALVTGSTECELVEDAEPEWVVEEMGAPVRTIRETNDEGECVERTEPFLLEGLPIPGGKLRALAEGYGLRRANPEIRRFMSLAQLIVDPTDPGVVARHLAAEPLEYPSTGEKTGARFLIVTTVGDMNVPANSGITIGRAAGVIDFLDEDPRYGKPVNQILIDTWTSEAVNVLGRHKYKNPPDYGDPEMDRQARNILGLDDSLGVHFDVENFSGGDDIWGDNIPRLDPGLRLLMTHDMWGNDLGGLSGAIFPYAVPQGQHGFPLPGALTDSASDLCKLENGANAASCSTQVLRGQVFDIGWFMFHAIGEFLKESDDPFRPNCNTKEQCPGIPETPPQRDRSELP